MKIASLLAATAAIALTGSVIAQETDETGTNFAEDQRSDERTGVELLAMSQDLYAYGVDARDPLALIVAARIRQGVEVEDREYEVDEQGGEPEDAEIEFASAEDMLDEARVLARGDEALASLIEEVEADASRGRVGGPGRDTGWVGARSTTSYNVTFRGGERAAIWASGPGRTDLDMYVYDQNGNLICRHIDYSDRMSCFWTPRWTGTFRVQVRNLGNVGVSYNIVTN
ncbi:MAG: hypothetical protein ACQRW7_08560 [Caulobacterales bacterium]|uniref:hypothetical protein n=1 Tax=Glycocaulis sp. TaxID=1969725 RepID=UPI003F9FA25B